MSVLQLLSEGHRLLLQFGYGSSHHKMSRREGVDDDERKKMKQVYKEKLSSEGKRYVVIAFHKGIQMEWKSKGCGKSITEKNIPPDSSSASQFAMNFKYLEADAYGCSSLWQYS